MSHQRAAVAALSCIAATLYLLLPGTASGDEEDTRVDKSQCHGNPNWCLKVSNETDTTVKVFVDGDDIWRMAPGEVDYFPLSPDVDHMVNVCMLYVFSADRCLAPDKVQAKSDYVLVVYPQQ